MTNGKSNSVMALKVAADGTLSDGTITCAGGARMQGILNGGPAAVDTHFNQETVKIACNVNPISEF
jgi:hypothetical protein